MADSEKTFPDSHSAPGRAADTRYSVSRRQGFRQLLAPRQDRTPALATGEKRIAAPHLKETNKRKNLMPEHFSVTLLGTGTPMFNPARACSSTLVTAGDKTFIVDTGRGFYDNLFNEFFHSWIPEELIHEEIVTYPFLVI